MEYHQLIIYVGDEHAELIADQLSELGAVAVSIEAADQQEVFQLEPEESPLWKKIAIKALFDHAINGKELIAFLEHHLDLKPIEYRLEIIKDQDWVRLTQQNFPPQCYADYLWVIPTWEKDNVNADCKVIIDPGLAFGTGNHATTALCLEWLAKHPPKGKTVIDYGCGSGILALAALALGARHVLAVDHDPQAIEATHNNSELNQFINSDNLTIALPNEVNNLSADVVIANILANPLLELQPLLTQAVKPEGHLILSGILTAEKETIIKSYNNDYALDSVATKDEWCRIDFS